MKVIIDTTVFLAECLLPTQKYPKLFRKIVSGHTLVIPERQIDEIRAIMEEFFPEEGDTVELFLAGFSYEKAEDPGERSKEYPFLAEARNSGVEEIITLDPDLAGTVTEGIRFTDPDSFLDGKDNE